MLSGEFRKTSIAQVFDVFRRRVGRQQETVVLFQARRFLLASRLLGDLSGALLRIQAPNLDSFAVENRAFLLGVLRRDTIAVVHDPLLVDPAIDGLTVLVVGVCMPDAGSHQT